MLETPVKIAESRDVSGFPRSMATARANKKRETARRISEIEISFLRFLII